MIRNYLQLIRPANVVTAISDVLAGVALSGLFTIFDKDLHSLSIVYLCISTVCLYAAGIVFNDIFDFELDKVERPERVLPSGRVSLKNAIIFGTILNIVGIISAFQVSVLSGYLAVAIAISCLVYDKFAKHNAVLGPLNMGLCRGLNLLLGMSILNLSLFENYWLAIIPIAYIAAITMVSRGEVHGGNTKNLIVAAFIYAYVAASQLVVAYYAEAFVYTLAFVLLYLYLIFKPLYLAYKNPIGPNIGKAVKVGVLSLIIMNAAWVSVSGNLWLAVAVALLLPICIRLAKMFAVT